jgi:hypothetical protein
MVFEGVDPGFKVRGVTLKKIVPSGGRRDNFRGISCENHDFMPKNLIFSISLALQIQKFR